MTSRPTLSVIVIARNEEKTIGACLTSCIEAVHRARATNSLESAEVVLVDSASSDATVEIAQRLPVRVIRIPKDWPLSAAAGRYVGIRSTESEFILFVDGDYVLNPDWLAVGLRTFAEDSTVAGVCGVDHESLRGTTAISRYLAALIEDGLPLGDMVETDSIAVGLYRRDWVTRAGGIQPFLKGAEDRDLAIRVRLLGGILLKTRAPMGLHYWVPEADLDFVEYLRSVSRWSFGEGQAARISLSEPAISRVYVKRYMNVRHLLQLEVGLLLGTWVAATLAATCVGNLRLAAGIFATGTIAFWASTRHTRDGMTGAFLRIYEPVYALTRIGSFIVGFLRPPRPTSDYPARDVEFS